MMTNRRLASEERNAEHRIRETEQRFRIMADAAPVLLWMSREDSLCTFFNQSWLNFTGRTQEEEWGVGWAEGVHFEDLQRCIDTYVDAFNCRKVFEMEYRLRRADGEYRWILDRGVPRYAPDGRFAGYIGSCIDIGERKQLEADLRHALRAKNEFLGMVSHELRTPITAMQLQLERFRRDGMAGLSGSQRDTLERMERSMSRLGELINSLLEFSRIERGSISVQLEPFQLEQLVRSTVDEARASAEKRGLELRVCVAEDLPPLVSDRQLVQLAVSNLLTNALKFTERGFVEVSLTTYQDYHRVAVRDSGPGIPAEEHQRVFEPFEQLEHARQKHTPGVGLGLALVKAMVTSLGGQIGLESQVGQGSQFTVLFPSAGNRAHSEGQPK